MLSAVLAAGSLFSQNSFCQSSVSENKGTPLTRAIALLKGDWLSPAQAGQGQPSGGFFFHAEVQGKVLTRRNWAEYPATKDHPASRHDDVMLIYDQAGTKPPRAFYLDNEGHAIEYTVEVTGESVIFTSTGTPGELRYRLTYKRTGPDTLAGSFETAPAGSPSAFAMTFQWTGQRAH